MYISNNHKILQEYESVELFLQRARNNAFSVETPKRVYVHQSYTLLDLSLFLFESWISRGGP